MNSLRSLHSIGPLMWREWLQHRFAWAMLMAVPLAVALLPLALASIEFGEEMAQRAPPQLALTLAFIGIVATTSTLPLFMWFTSVFIAIGSPRRDHGDRSIEFWLSLPTGHAASLATPVVVHMVLAPAVAVVAGLLGGIAISLLLVSRFVGLGEWFALPWGGLIAAGLALAARLMAGLPMVLLWLLPVLLLTMLANAAFKRWGLPVLAVAIGLSGLLLDRVFGVPVVFDLLGRIAEGAAQSLAGASGEGVTINSETSPPEALSAMPAWAWNDFVAALRALFSPLLAGGLLVSAGLFYLLVLWRQRGAGGAT